MTLADNLSNLLARHEELRALLSSPDLQAAEFVKLSREFSELTPIADAVAHAQNLRQELEDAQTLTSDPDLGQEAKQEVFLLTNKLREAEAAVKRRLIPRDADDERNAILEVRAGTGGDEAALFAALLFEMYRRYAALQGWGFELLSASESDLGGMKEASALISGRGVFARLKFESGVHRVQRVPKTESAGRVHTSAATVAVLPEVEDVDITINDSDLRIDTYRASGAGGQHVNKTDSAVRITHIPTGTVVAMQDERSQIKNRMKAMKILRAKLHEREQTARESAHAAQRRVQVGSGDRSERIRTYNFPQGRVTDHRINLTLYKIDEIIAGSALDEIINALIAEDEAKRLADLEG